MNEPIRIQSLCTIHTCLLPCNFLHLKPFPSSSFKMRFWKSLTMRGSPSLSEILGSQLSNDFALLMSGFLLWGSSAVFALNSIVALGSIVSLTTYTIRTKKKCWSCCYRSQKLFLILSHWECTCKYSDSTGKKGHVTLLKIHFYGRNDLKIHEY